MSRKAAFIAIAIDGRIGVAVATTAEAGDCPSGFIAHTTQYCFQTLFGVPFCQDYTTCTTVRRWPCPINKLTLWKQPHQPAGLHIGPFGHGHPIRAFR